ncbi:MAG: inositol monophosphatase [Deltaproteobacteria bacterium]|nr:inositol monophosphatase [Deltaproteobacteria bacterium]
MKNDSLNLEEAVHTLLPLLQQLHRDIRTAVLAACASSQDLAAVAHDGPGDTIYAVDKVSEALLVEALRPIAARWPLRLVAEGLQSEGAEGSLVLPLGTDRKPVLRVIVDPIDGTRGLMYQKRPAWVLTGVALEGNGTRTPTLDDVFLAVQTELPLLKQHLCDDLWATRMHGKLAFGASRFNLLSQQSQPLRPAPSRATTLLHGFATVCRFFPGARDLLGTFDERLMHEVLGAPQAGKALSFEDQYASTGGQLYELIMGHDRFIADLRPLLIEQMQQRHQPLPLCCHPYDVCTALIAEAAGVVLTDAKGGPLNPPLDVDHDVAWVGYASPALHAKVAPLVNKVLLDMAWLPGDAA